MPEHPADLLDFDPSSLRIGKDLKSRETSSIFEVQLLGHRYAMKVVSWLQDSTRRRLNPQFHDNGDPGFTIPYYYGYIDQLDPASFKPHLNHFVNDSHAPKAILLEYLQDIEELNCVNYSDDRLQAAVVGLEGIHSALIHHHDVYPKNILIVRGPPERVVWMDFDVAVTFDPGKPMGCQGEEYCNFEMELIEGFGELLREDQRQGLPPNTKFY